MNRPTYLEALRLRERIVAETDPEELKRMDSVVVEKLDRAGGSQLATVLIPLPVINGQ